MHCNNENERGIDEDDSTKRSASLILETASLLESPYSIDSSYEVPKNCIIASSDSINDFFGNTSTSSGTRSQCRQSGTCSSDRSSMEERMGTNSSHEVDINEENDHQKFVNCFTFLDDYIRFDVSRTGFSCFSSYSVSVQYEDNFLEGNAGGEIWNLACGRNSRITVWYRQKIAFQLEYPPRVSCVRPKDCVYRVKLPDQQTTDVGTIHFQGDIVRVYNSYENSLSFRRKQGGSNSYLYLVCVFNFKIKAETGEKLASVELFRGFRGDIIYYGLSILGDVSSVDKALLIALTLIMDIRQRESEMRCTFLWVPLFCILVIGLFSVLPWVYFRNENA